MIDFRLNQTEEFLSEILCHPDSLDRDKLSSLFSVLGEKYCFDTCEKNNVTCIAYYSLNQCQEIYLPEYWKDKFIENEKRISEYMGELDNVSTLLIKHDIRLVALKNSGIARSLFPVYGASPMGDIDVLVKKSDFRKAHKLLINNNYKMKFRSPLEEENIESAELAGGSEYSIHLDSGSHLWFELQWRPISGRWIREDQEPSSEDLISRSIPIERSDTRLLSPEDNLLQVALHTAKHTYVRAPGFRLHTDVDRIIRSSDIDWIKFKDEVEALEVKTAVYLSLLFAQRLLKTPVPEDVINDLAPNKLKIKIMLLWLRKVGLFDPDGKKWGRIGYVIFVSLLYDNFQGLCKSAFPSQTIVRSQYPHLKNAPLIWLYIIRLSDLLIKRILVK